MEQPKWVDYMLPVLNILNDGKEHKRRETIEAAADSMGLGEDLKSEKIGSGEYIYHNRCSWALSYLKQSGLISSPERAVFVLTKAGKDVLSKKPQKMTEEDLASYAGYKEFMGRAKGQRNTDSNSEEKDISSLSPDELIAKAELEIKNAVCSELLTKVRSMSPDRFEKLVVELLLAMGYGDKNDPDSGFVVGQSGDGGIDGVIKQNKLGLESVYVQAKRYGDTNKVSPHDVRDFAGALMGSAGGNSKKGVFITSSDFTEEGKNFVKGIDKNFKIVLINGTELVELMYQYGIGVSNAETIVLNKVDNDYFDED